MIQTFKTDLEKASFVLDVKYDTPSEEVGGMLYIDVTERLSVAIDRAQIEDLAEEYDEYIRELNQ